MVNFFKKNKVRSSVIALVCIFFVFGKAIDGLAASLVSENREEENQIEEVSFWDKFKSKLGVIRNFLYLDEIKKFGNLIVGYPYINKTKEIGNSIKNKTIDTKNFVENHHFTVTVINKTKKFKNFILYKVNKLTGAKNISVTSESTDSTDDTKSDL